MSTQTLSDLTLETLANYRTAATQAVGAYRAGSHRLVDMVNGTLENQVYPRTAKIAPRATEGLNGVRGSVSEIVVKGIDAASERTERAIEVGSEAAVAQLTKFADYMSEIDNAIVAGGLNTAARLSMPVAKLALVVSSKVAEGATALADAAGADAVAGVKRSVRKAAGAAKRHAEPVARKAKAGVKRAAARVRKAAE
jgi:hypothetical protein